jgi:hypothetical protein
MKTETKKLRCRRQTRPEIAIGGIPVALANKIKCCVEPLCLDLNDVSSYLHEGGDYLKSGKLNSEMYDAKRVTPAKIPTHSIRLVTIQTPCAPLGAERNCGEKVRSHVIGEGTTKSPGIAPRRPKIVASRPVAGGDCMRNRSSIRTFAHPLVAARRQKLKSSCHSAI